MCLISVLALIIVSGCNQVRAAPIPTHPAYAISVGSAQPARLEVIDTDLRKIVHETSLSDFPGPSIAIAPNGKVYVPIQGSAGATGKTVAIYTPGDYQAKEVRVGNDPWAVVASPDGKVYVMNQDGGHHGSLSVLDSKTDQVIRTIDIGLMPQSMAISDNGRWLYVARDDPNYLYGKPFGFDSHPRPDEPPPAPVTIAVVDTLEASVIKIVGLREGSFPRALVWTANKLYVALGSSQVDPDPKSTAGMPLGKTVLVLEASTLKVLKRIEVPPRPTHRMVLAPNGKLYLGHLITTLSDCI